MRIQILLKSRNGRGEKEMEGLLRKKYKIVVVMELCYIKIKHALYVKSDIVNPKQIFPNADKFKLIWS